MKFWLRKLQSSSINRFLIVGVLSLTTIYFITIYSLTQRQAIHEIEELFDAQLAHSSHILLNLLSESVSTIDQNSAHLPVVYFGFDDVDPILSNNALYEKKFAYQIYNDDGKLLVKSGSAPAKRLAGKKLGFSDGTIEQEKWRIYSLHDDDWRFWLHVAESVTIREELAENIARETLWPGILILPFALVFLYLIIRFALKPLKQLIKDIQHRDPKNLTSIEASDFPLELRPVLAALNNLFFRLDDAIKREQRLTADTAHELRTPLSVILLHAQNALRAKNQYDRDESLKELDLGVKRIARLLEQLLTLSKISPDTIPISTLRLYPLCQEIIAQMAPAIIEKKQEVSFNCAPADYELEVEGSEFLLEILLRNLIDNAREYGPVKGRISISLFRCNHDIELLIEDSGEGVDDESINILTDRFFREHQNQGKGAGLGLSLVSSIVDFHHGSLDFSHSSLGGLKVSIVLPSAAI